MNGLMKRLQDRFNQLFALTPPPAQREAVKETGTWESPPYVSTTPEQDAKVVEAFVRHGQEHGVTDLPVIPKIPASETSHLIILDSVIPNYTDDGRPKPKHPNREKQPIYRKKKKRRK